MSKSLIIVASLFPVVALAAQPAVVLNTLQMPNAHQGIAAHVPIRLSMGPDPGGKTGATVNPETTKTGSPSVDSATTPRSSSGTSSATGNPAQGSANPSNDSASSGERSKQKNGATENSAGGSAKPPANASHSDTNR